MKRIEEQYAIFSVAEICSDILMWSHYSDKHKGFCVGFDRVRLYEAIDDWRATDVACVILPVDYQQDFPNIVFDDRPNEIEFLNESLTTKAQQWEYEKEHRIILNGRTNVPVILPNGVIREVIIGAQASETTRTEIIEVVKSSDSGIKLYQARLAKDKFALEFDEIEY